MILSGSVRRAVGLGALSAFISGVASAAEGLPSAGTVDHGQIMGVLALRNSKAEADFSARYGFSRLASPAQWSDEVVYQIVVDRFNDGNPANNLLNIEEGQRDHQLGHPKQDGSPGPADHAGVESFRHGGDIRGIIDRLDYLSVLGVTSLWVTPILMNTGSYHGYCTSDFARIDPAYGSPDDLRELVGKAHRRGIRIIMDVVVNHICDTDTHYTGSFSYSAYGSCVNDHQSKFNTGSPENTGGQRQIAFAEGFFGPFRNQNYLNRCGWRPGASTGSGADALFGDYSGQMFDFDTMNYDFQDTFTELHKYWIAYADVDGFRLDAAKHVTADYVARFSTEIRAYAGKLGKKNFFLIGEVADSTDHQARYLGNMGANLLNLPDSPDVAAKVKDRLMLMNAGWAGNPNFPYPGLNAVYDFGHSGSVRDVFQGRTGPINIHNWYWSGGETENSKVSSGFAPISEAKTGCNTAENWNLIEIHDWPRFLDGNPSESMLRAALGYLLTAHGVPVLYYGVEQGLDGICSLTGNSMISDPERAGVNRICLSDPNSFDDSAHPRHRQDMFVTGPWRLGSVRPEIQRLAHIGIGGDLPIDPSAWMNDPSRWKLDPFLNTTHPLFQYVQRLVSLRKSCAPLRGGVPRFRMAGSAPGLLGYSRLGGGYEALVIANTDANQDHLVRELVIDNQLNGQTGRRFVNLLNPADSGTVVKRGGATFLNFGNGFNSLRQTVAIFVPEDHVAARKNGKPLCR